MPAKSVPNPSASKKALKIGVVLYGLTNPFFESIKQGLNDRIAEYNEPAVTIELRQTTFDAAKQLEAINEVAKAKIDGLILTPIDDARIRDKINELSSKKIPVVTLNSDISDTERIAYVGSNQYKCGRTAGQLMGMICPERPWEVGIITGSRNVSGHEERIRGFADVLKESYPLLTIERIEECNGDDYKAYEMIRRMLEEHPHMHAFYFTAGGVYGGCKFLYQMTKPRPYYVITFDELDTTRDFIDKGTINASVCQQPVSQGRLAVTTMINYLSRGILPEPINYTDIVIRIRENL